MNFQEKFFDQIVGQELGQEEIDHFAKTGKKFCQSFYASIRSIFKGKF